MNVSDLPWTAVLITSVGAVAIVAFALLIGVLESRSHQRAWRHIADARRIVQDRSRDLADREWEHDDLDGLPLCPECTRLLAQLSEEDENRGISH